MRSAGRKSPCGAGSHESSVPPSRQIADQLRERITSDDLARARLPSITTLMQDDGLARITAQRALAILEEQGMIEIVHGWRTSSRRRGGGHQPGLDRPHVVGTAALGE